MSLAQNHLLIRHQLPHLIFSYLARILCLNKRSICVALRPTWYVGRVALIPVLCRSRPVSRSGRFKCKSTLCPNQPSPPSTTEGECDVSNLSIGVMYVSCMQNFGLFLTPSPTCLHLHATTLTKLPYCICFWGTSPIPPLPVQTS